MSTIRRICQNKTPYLGCYVVAVLDPSGMEKQHYILHRMIKMASCTGISAVQFKLENAEGVDLLRLGETIELAKSQGLETIGEPWNFDSADQLVKAGVEALNIGSQQLENLAFSSYCAQMDVPLLISIHSDWDRFYAVFQAMTLHCTELCLMITPPRLDDDAVIDIIARQLSELKQRFPGTVTGYAGDEGNLKPALAAFMLGASVVQKFFTLNYDKGNNINRLDLSALHRLSRDLGQVQKLKGKLLAQYEDLQLPQQIGELVGLYAARNVGAGSIININDIKFQKPAAGLPAYRAGDILGKRLYTDITADQPFQSVHFSAVD